ncbi:MAG: cell division protein SepF [Lachnospira sp.]|nr:cell division protein SepF [Lachnospira sp.]
MGMFDGITNMFKLHDDDDFDDDYEDYDDEFDDDSFGDEKLSTRKKLFSGASKKDSSSADEDVSYTAEKPVRFASKSKVVPMKTQSPRGLEVVVIRPESMEDAKEITDTLLTGKAVVLNLEGIHVEIAQRIIDYSAGSTYAIRGNLQKITNYIFLVTPPNVDISGDIPEIVTGGIDLSSFNKNENRF